MTLIPLLLVACGGSGTETTTGTSTGATGGSAAASGTGGATAGTGGSSAGTGGASAGTGGSTPATTGATTSGSGGGAPGWDSGNPQGSCTAGVPVGGKPADTSSPTTVVGTGTPASCTFSDLKAAVAKGGVITFDCGAGAFTLPVTATLKLPIDKNTVIDGGKKVTLDGGGAVQILRFDSANFQANEHRLTLQNIALKNGKQTPSTKIPDAPAPCSQGWDDGQGGALFMRDGNLTIIDSIFEGNQAAPLGPDTGGGAIYVLGSKHGALIVNSTFKGNKASNAGAVGGLFCELDIYDSYFTSNTAIGNGANNDDATKCSVIHIGQHEVGSGGNGGAIYSDGASVNVTLCGDLIENNNAGMGAFGGGLFFTSNDFGGTLSIIDTTMTGNTGGHWTNVKTGSVTNVGTAVGTNTKSITLQNSTLQGVP
jgi:hypothetical protein